MKNIARKQTNSINETQTYYQGPMFARPGEVGPLFGYCDFESKNKLDCNFAIIDLETSGLSSTTSRILEVAILVIDHKGNVLKEFETLINPQNEDVGRTDIHKISLDMLRNAPNFSEIADEILSLLSGNIVVAHNAKFEENFLSQEFSRIERNISPIPAIDSMWISQMTLDLANYKLATVAGHFGVEIEKAHTAMGDIIAMKNFFPELLTLTPEIRFPCTETLFEDIKTLNHSVTRGS